MEEKIKNLLEKAGVDFERTMERFMNNEAFYLKFLKRFPTDPNFTALKEALEAKDMEGVERAAHTLKGVSANLGLDPVAEHLNEMVRSVRNNECGNLTEQFEKVQEQYLKFTGIIEEIPAQ